MNRKTRRAVSRKNRDKMKQMEEQIALFQNLPSYCLTCEKDFDKKNKEMVSSWNVVVKGETVRLYCPDCWSRAKEMLNEMKKEFSK